EKAADKLGIRPMVFKSGPHKDLASPFRTPTPEEEAILQGVIDEAYGQFVAAVASGRKMAEARVREIADGRIYTGAQARSLGLVDHLGGRDLALRRARELAKAPRARLVRYTRSPGLLGSLVGIRGASLSGLLPERARGLGIDLTPGLKYLWLPN
ncbi:MAG: S49 family peptidase, partial [Actinomycetota bacterium]